MKGSASRFALCLGAMLGAQFSATLFGQSGAGTAWVRHGPTINATVEGSLQQMTHELTVKPLLTPAGQLLPGGKLRLWIGCSDGVPLRNAEVTVTIPDPNDLNRLTDGTSLFLTVTVQTDVNGIAEVKLTPNNGADDGGGGGPSS